MGADVTRRRLPGWEVVLERTIDQARDKVFAWGRFDCALWACDVVLAITGIDPAEAFRGTYADERGAHRALWLFAAGGLLATAQRIAERQGWPAIEPAYAQTGDFAIIGGPQGDACGIVLRDQVVGVTTRGLCFVPASRIVAVWAI